MQKFYKLLNVQTDEEMAQRLQIGIQDLKQIRRSGCIPWEHLTPALLDAGFGVEVSIGNMTIAMLRNPKQPAAASCPCIMAKVNYNQMLALRRMQLI